jgi:hypothetical protein
MPKISVVIPIHNMKGGADFLWRSIDILSKQTFKDFELIITQEGRMAENTNAGIRRARGELIKILYLDDYLSTEFALEDIAINFKDEDMWMISGCSTNPEPYWTDDIYMGNNHLGSPSCLTIRNKDPLLFDEEMSWLLDCDYYKRMYDLYGPPKILEARNVVIGVGDHQMTHILTDEQKLAEYNYMHKKYEKD